ncbi:MAG TPA: hypothetical protein VGB75_10140 [Jatrophihabitans sp.]|uniref:hypothetical protein n=1 Tax=Jatrophihabitans sp. TaxID=1932789 RepID=UPI002EF9405B
MSSAENQPAAAQHDPAGPRRANGDSSTPNNSTSNNSTPNSSAMFSGAPTNVQAGGVKPETEQLNLRIRADLYRQLDRVSVILGARRGVPTNRVTVVEEALTAYFEANRTSS